MTRGQRTVRSGLLVAIAALLAACENQSASVNVDGRGSTFTLIRQRAPWNSQYDLALVVARLPDCQRRHRLQPAPKGAAALNVFRGEDRYRLRQGGRDYAVDMADCELQPDPAPQRDPGELLGVFESREGRLTFVPGAPAARAARGVD